MLEDKLKVGARQLVWRLEVETVMALEVTDVGLLC